MKMTIYILMIFIGVALAASSYHIYSLFCGGPIAKFKFERLVQQLIQVEYPNENYTIGEVKYSLKLSTSEGPFFDTVVKLQSGTTIVWFTKEGVVGSYKD